MLLVGLCAYSRTHLVATSPKIYGEAGHAEEVRYLPREEALQKISLEYANVLADVIWFSTINYFGKRFNADEDYRWLTNFCRSMVTLDPRAEYVYPFCGLTMAYEVQSPHAAIELFAKGIETFPDNWMFLYYRGIIKLNLLKDVPGARVDLQEASLKPGAPPSLPRLVVRLAKDEGKVLNGEELEDFLQSIPDPAVKEIMRRKFNEMSGSSEKSNLKPVPQPSAAGESL